MAGRIPESFINDLLGRVDIVDVIGPQGPTQEIRSQPQGPVPVPRRENAVVQRQRGPSSRSTASGAKRTARRSEFLMEYDNQTFPEAIETLAVHGGHGGSLGRRAADLRWTPSSTTCSKPRPAQFQRWLRGDDEASAAVAYLKRTGSYPAKIARDFGIGLAPKVWNRLRDRTCRPSASRSSIDAGLARAGQDERRRELRPVPRAHRVPDPQHPRSRYRFRRPRLR